MMICSSGGTVSSDAAVDTSASRSAFLSSGMRSSFF